MSDHPTIALATLHLRDNPDFLAGLYLLARGGLGCDLAAVCFSSGLPGERAFLCAAQGSRTTYFFPDGRPAESEWTRMLNAEPWKNEIYQGVSNVVHAIRKRSLWDVGIDYSSALLARPDGILALGGRLKTQPEKAPINLYIPAAAAGHDQLEDLARLEAEYPGRFRFDHTA